eukprot:jgi/Botrbrau1/13280/Bobra.27_2s0003.1
MLVDTLVNFVTPGTSPVRWVWSTVPVYCCITMETVHFAEWGGSGLFICIDCYY